MKDGAGLGQRVAFYGGSFDPPHVGHLAVARAARDAMRLDAVLFAPVGAQPLKPQGASAGFADRVAMTRLAIAGERGLELSLTDMPKASGEPNFTLETLQKLKAEIGPAGALFCLMGADAFAGLKSWRQAGSIPFAAHLIVASRPGQPLERLDEGLPAGLEMELDEDDSGDSGERRLRYGRLRNREGETAPVYLLPGLHVDVSASEIRQEVHAARGAGMAGENWVAPAVAEYIRSHGLYR